MMLAPLRLGFLVTTLVVSPHVAAATRFWTLTGVQFDDGTTATGHFSYDDTTQTVANWNIRTRQSLQFWVSPFTYVPGNSIGGTRADEGHMAISFYSEPVAGRYLWFAPLIPLDGNNATVPIDFSYRWNEEGHAEFFYPYHSIIAGSLTLMQSPPSVAIVQVDEFYHPGLRHYFITSSAAEKQDLDTGVHPGWVRTGQSFMGYATGSNATGSINPVCRYYGDPLRGLDSHFYSADAAECWSVDRRSDWRFESDSLFQINLPNKATGACADGTNPVYRLWNQRVDSNHRYTTSVAIKQEMLAAGYAAEGYGSEGVVMCAVQ